MRKTSHDGADSSSITSGKDNETKKSGTTFNKMTKSSIKRRVQNFSHESDDGIIEPLLQTEKDKIEIANRSAKYLINKSKTESLHEKDNKVTDGYADKCSVPVPVSSTSNMIINNVKESPVSTSYNCGSAPIHNHMNTNIFSTYETSTGLITTKNQILVEIDNSKPGRYSPSPLIFTTAKIHTDSKTKLMEPLQVTPVPILSTIEGNIVKAGVIGPPETSNLNKTSSDDMKALSRKPEINVLQTHQDKKISPTVAHPLLKSETLNENVKKPPTTTSSANLFYKDVKLGQLSNTINLPVAAKLAINDNISVKEKSTTDIQPEIKSTEKYTSAASSKNKSEKCSSIDKSKESFHTLDNKIVPAPLDVLIQEKTHTTNSESLEHGKTHFISNDTELPINIPISSNKKLQRQLNASSDAKTDSFSKIGKTDTQSFAKEVEENFISKTDKVLKVENTSDSATRVTHPKVSSIPKSSAEHLPKDITTSCITSSYLTEVKTTSNVTASIPKIKSVTETVNLKPTVSDVYKDVPKSVSKSSASMSQSDVKHTKESTTTSSMPASTAPLSSNKLKHTKESTTTSSMPASTASLSSNKLTTISVSGKPDTLSSSSCLVEANPSIKCTVTTVNTTLPSYIVSTSKTKIGSTLTYSTPAITSKSQVQKPFNNVNTTSAYCVKSFATPGTKTSPSTSDSNGTKHMNFSKQTKSKAETIKKDGRA